MHIRNYSSTNKDYSEFVTNSNPSKFRPIVIQISRFLNDALSLEASGGPAEQVNHVKFRMEEALKTLEAERGHKQTLLGEIDGLHDQVRYSELQL